MIDLDDNETSAFLHSGCALLVGTIGADGLPRACRAWGLSVVDAGSAVIRVLVEDDDPVTLKNLRDDGRVAVTATSVRTHRSIQFKGRVVSTERPTAEDEARREHYTKLFLTDINDSHRYSPEMLARWARQHVVACVVELAASFDQTPGPSAGSVIDKDNR
jgi:hypothetical protein